MAKRCGYKQREANNKKLHQRWNLDAPITILPTAAAPDNNHEWAGRNGQRWFRSLGASHVDLVPVTDKQRCAAARPIVLLVELGEC